MTLEEFKAQYGQQNTQESAPVQQQPVDNYSNYSQPEPTPSESSGGAGMSLAEFKEAYQPKEQQYSVQQTAQQANGGQSFLNTAMTDVTGAAPVQPTAPKAKADIKTTDERDALIEEYKRISNSNAIPATRRRDEIRSRLNEIDTELGNGAMDYTFGDRTASVLGGAVKGYGADMLNAGATSAAGLSQLGEKLGGDTGEYAGWATDEVSRAAIPQQNDAGYYEQQRQEIADMQDTSDRLAQSSAEDINRAKNGTSGVTKFAVDIGTNAIQMGMDGLAATLTGGASLVPMFARSMGGGAREARQDGATTGQQLLYGTVKGGIEVATEKMFDGLAGIYGKGTADEAVEKLIRKLGNGSDAQMTALRTFFSGLGEAVEEGVSGAADPFTKMIYQGIDSLPKNLNSEALSDTLYSMLVGFAMGGAGGAVNIVNGENARQNSEALANIQQANEIQNNLVQNNGMSKADSRRASEILAKMARGETITTKESAFLDSVREANGINTSATTTAEQQTPAAPTQQAEATEAQTAQPSTTSHMIDDAFKQQTAPSQQNIDNTATIGYTNNSNTIGGAADVAGRSNENSGDGLRLGEARMGENAPGGISTGADRASNGTLETNPALAEAFSKSGVVNYELQDRSNDSAAFSAALDEARNSNPNGWMVSPQTVDNLAGKRLFTTPDGLAGMAVTTDGDIEAIFRNPKSQQKGVLRFMLPQAIANGGTKLDCYGEPLAWKYAQYGFIPVARVKFDPQYANPGWTPDKGTPTLYVMMHNGDSADTVVNNAQNYTIPTQAELDALPLMDYNEAIQYRDGLLAQRGNDSNTPTSETSSGNVSPEQTQSSAAQYEMTTTEYGFPVEYRGYTFKNEDFDGDFWIEVTGPNGESHNISMGAHSDAEDYVRKARNYVDSVLGPENSTETHGTASRPAQHGETPTSQQNASTGESEQFNSKSDGPWVPPTNTPGSSEPKVSQTSTNSMRNTAEQNGAEQEDLTYIPKSERESLNNAMNRAAADKVGEMNNLMGKEMWTGEDIDTAMTIYGQLKYDSVQQHDSAAADAWAKIVQEHGTRSGQALQAFAKWARTGKAAQMDIDSMIDATEGLSDSQKQTIKEDVHKFTEQFDSIDDGDVDSVRKLILEQNEYRKTGTFSKKRFEKLLNEIDDFDWLKEFALRQARNIPADFTEKPSLGQKLKTWQVNSQLSRVGTFFRNLGGNLSFGGIDIFSQDAFGYAIDNLVSKATGKKEIGFDKGWLSKTARNAAVDAMHRSILEVAADVDMSGQSNAYGTTSSRTFKMASGNKAQQVMSRWEQLLGYSLTTSDRFFRGQLEQSYAESLMAQGVEESEARNLAKQVADYRLFQNQGRAAQFSKSLHDVGNRLASIGNEETGQFGLGDLLNPYPGVPANLAVKALEYSPANIVKGGYEIVKLLNDAKAGKAVSGQQMTAVMDVARGMSGTAIIALFTALAKTGLFKNSDDEDDYDVAAMNSAQNLSGTQWNLSATMRAMQGEKAEWKDGDTLMKISWLEPMSAFMSIASMIAESDDENPDLSSMASRYFEGAVNAALDLPVFENIQNAVNTFNYSTGDTFLQKGLEAGAQFAGDALGGMIPAPISQTARVLDDYVRDTKGDTKAETAYNAFLNSIPGLRNTLPVKTDNFGNARENEPSMYNRFMNSFVRPGAISTFRETAVQDELSRIYDSTGDVALYPDRNGPKSITVNGEKVTLSADESRAFHEFAGQKSEEYVNALIESKSYKLLDDKQKSAAIKEMYSIAEGLAKDAYISGNGLTSDSVSDGTALLGGVDKAGTSRDKTPLDEANLANYITYTELMKSSIKSGDYETLDKQVGYFKGMNENLRTVLTERNSDLKRLLEYKDIGLGSETYAKVKAAIPDAQNELDANSTTSSLVRLYGLAKADIPEKDRAKIIEQLVQGSSGFVGSHAKAAFKTLNQYGLTVSQTAQFFDIALNSKTWKDSGEKADVNGQLRNDTTAFAIMQIPGLSEQQRTAIYNSIRSQVSNKFNDWGTYSYQSEVKYVTKATNKALYQANTKITDSMDTLISAGKAS